MEFRINSLTMELPLVVDLDRTLCRTDTLFEQFVAALFSKPMVLLLCLPKLLRGRAAFKAAMANAFEFSPDNLPLRQDLIAWLEQQAASGRELHLYTAANQRIADSVAERVGLFSSAAGSEATNLKGRAKAAALGQRFPDGFSYAGDSPADLSVWRVAQGIVLVAASKMTSRAARKLGKPIEAVFTDDGGRLKDWIRAIRVHQWSKNVLVFLPLVLGHDWNNGPVLLKTAVGFLILLMVVSSTYLINDLADLDSDRAHWSKRFRPIAAGRIPVMAALGAASIGIMGGTVLAFLLSAPFALALMTYLAVTLSYSFGLKGIPLLDTLIIGALFTLRLVMGMALSVQIYSPWLLAFSMFFFFSLAMAKRHTELLRTLQKGGVAARGYRTGDMNITAIFGISTGISSLIILSLYVVEDIFQRVHYDRPHFLWAIPLMVSIWIGRIWLLAQRGEMADDPVTFALRDRASLGLGLGVLLAFVLAL